MKQYVYIVLDTATWLVKIGLSQEPQCRFKAFRKPSGLQLLAVLHGSRQVEMDLHARFAEYHNRQIADFAKANTLPLAEFLIPVTFPLVLPDDLRRAVKIAAVENRTTMQKLIIAAIEAEYPGATA